MGNCSCPSKQADLDVIEDPGRTSDVALAPDVEEKPVVLVPEAMREQEKPEVVIPKEELPVPLNTAPTDEQDANVNAEVESPKKEVVEPFQDRMYKEVLEKAGRKPEEMVIGKVARRPSSENISFDAYTQLHSAQFEKVLELEKPDGWEFKKEEDGVQVYTKAIPGQRLLYFKGVAEFKVEGGVGTIMQKIFTSEDRPKWDEMCLHGETLQNVAPKYKITYVQIAAPFVLISTRDLLTMGRFRFEPDGTGVAAIRSIELPEYPERSDMVRANFLEGGYVLRPKGPSTYQVTWTGCADPGGWLPTFVVNYTVTKQALTLAKLKKLF